MSRSWCLVCLFKKGNIHDSLSRLFDASQTSHIEDWSYRLPEGKTLADVMNVLQRIDALPDYSFEETMRIFRGYQDAEAFEWLPIRLGDYKDGYFLYDALTRQKSVVINAEPTLYLGASDMVAFEIELPTSTAEAQTSRGVWLTLQPVLELIQPYYCFSTAFPDHLDDYLYNEDKAFLTQPWQHFWNTVVYNLSFIETLGLSQAFQALKENDEAYYYKELDNLIWISSPLGMGNENPSYYYAKYGVDHFDDSKISRFVSLWNEQHHRNIVTRLKLLSPLR